MDALYAIQQDLNKQIANAFSNFKKKGAAKMSIITAQARLHGLENCYSQFTTNHQKILSSKGIALDHEYFLSELNEQTTDSFYDRKGEFLQFIDDTKQLERDRDPPPSPQAQQGLNATINTVSIETQSLPKMNLPKFSGKFSEWENFRDLFRSVVHRRSDLDSSIKYYHLRTNLTGEAMEHIKAIPIAGDQYERAWNTLVTYYDNKRRTVNTLIASIFAIKPMKAESQTELKRVSRELYSPLESLEKLGRTRADIGNDLLVYLTVELLDSTTRKEWKKSIDKSNDTPPSIEQLKEFIKGQIENLDDGKELVVSSSNSAVKGKTNKQKQTKGDSDATAHSLQTTSKENQVKTLSCVLCKGDHTLGKCEQFSKKSIAERREFVKEKRMCFNCLNVGHPKGRCKSRYNCFTCKARHHTLLHLDGPEPEHIPSNSSDNPQNSSTNCSIVMADLASSTTHTTQASGDLGILLATALVRIIGPKGKELTVKALIDPCSQVSLLTQNLQNQLALTQSDARVHVQGVGEKSPLLANKMAHFKLTPHFTSSYVLEASALVLPKLTSYKPPTVRATGVLNYLRGLQLADPTYLDSSHIELLLGADLYTDFIEGEITRGSSTQPIAMSSKLGWLLMGKCSGLSSQSSVQILNCSVHCTSQCDEESSLLSLLEEFWRVEETPDGKKFRTLEEKACEELYESTTYRDENGRYVVRLPWKDAEYARNAKLGNSFRQALNALKRLEATFQKDKRLEVEYKKFMREYLELGHMTEVKGEEPSANSNHFFLPHHGVWKDSSTTTKLRTVFNGSSKFNSKESLNDLLYTGSNFLIQASDNICIIRNYKIALSADVEKHFRQVGVHEQDRRFQTIIWRFSPLEKIRMFLLNTLTYGLTCSSYLAMRTLKRMADDYEQEYPIAASIVRLEMYSDNVLTGAHSLAEAKHKAIDLVSLFKQAQMNLRKWVSNDSRALEFLPENMIASERVTLFNPNASTPILGIAWHTSDDYFCFHLEEIEIKDTVTKRCVLSRIARTYDPLGWIAPVTIVAKILLQSLWLQKVGWDTPLQKSFKEKWFHWLKELPSVSSIKIPRWTGYTPQTKVELHGFADASKVAYGAVLYLRFMRESSITTSLQLAKSKVAPVKTISIPRLELCASLLLTRLAKHFLASTKLDITDVHLWTDSADVLFWLKDHPSRWNVFIANRCSEIHTSLPNAYWHHVRSKDNPADLVSRGVDPSRLQSNELWWKGPTFLISEKGPWSKKQDELNFGVSSLVTVNTCKASENAQALIEQDNIAEVWPPLKKFSSLTRLLRVTAYCLRFISRCTISIRANQRDKHEILNLTFVKENFNSDSKELEQVELTNAELFCCYLTQRASFRDEYSLLLAGKPLSDKNPLANLNPLIESHLIKVGGRLKNSLMKERAKHPVILPQRSELTTLIIRRAHFHTLHGGVQLTLATLRQRVWILRGRSAVKSIIRNCISCTRHSARVLSQQMGDLPEARVRSAYPFENTGVDYAGPIKVRLTKARGKGTLKGFVCVFVCMVTRAVHLELAEDYSAESFIAAFHRFTARRGHCRDLYSDQGTNFVGADSSLKEMLNDEKNFQSQTSRQLADVGTEWHFNPPSAPHFGGLWEAAVRSLKYHLRRVIGDQVLTFSEFSTLLCRVEACLNSRPLGGLSDDPSDLNYLSPAHFLIQRASYLVPEPDISNIKIPIGKRWQLLTQTVQHFWTRWRQEYLSTLQSRSKWQKPRVSLKVGDLVLIKSELSPPAKWPLGRISAVHPGSDGLVRVATVTTANGSLKRPIVKLILLPVCE